MLRSLSFTLAVVAGLCPAAESFTPITVPAATPHHDVVVVTGQAETSFVPDAAQAGFELSQIAGGTDVISSEVLRQGRQATMRDALGTSPGIYVQPRAGAEESRLSIRGSGIQRTFHLRGIMLLQDGQPINQADGGGDFQAIDPGLVDHISVYRGANALRFGSATLGGAIDFVSPTGLNHPGADLRIEGGSFGYLKTQAVGGFTTGDGGGDVDGLVAVANSVTDGYRGWSANANQRAFANVGWRPAPGWENRTYASFVRSDSQLPGALTAAQFADDPRQASPGSLAREVKRDYPLYRLADKVSWDLGPHRLEAGLGWTGKELFHPLTFGLITQDSNDTTVYGRWTWKGTIMDRPARSVLGGNAAWGVTDARTYAYANASGNRQGALTSAADQTARNLDGYGELQVEAIDAWWFSTGLQWSGQHRHFEDQFFSNGDQSDSKLYTGLNPKLGVLWQASQSITGFANISRSFEPPTFSEYVQSPAFGQPSEPYSDLESQSAWTLEVGSRGSAGPVTWDLTGYYAMIRDEYLAFQVGPGVQNTINADDTLHYGIEAGVAVVLGSGLIASEDRLILDTTYTSGSFRFVDDDTYGNGVIPGLPEHAARLELRWERAGWFTAVMVDWQSDWYVDFANDTEAARELLLGLRAGVQRPQGVTLFVEARNLADTAYVSTSGVANPASTAAGQALYNPGDGRSFTFGMQWRQ